MTIIRLKGNDEKIFEVELAIAKRSLVIHEMIESLGDEDLEEPLVLSEVKSDILEMVIKFATYHKNDPMPDKDNKKDKEENPKRRQLNRRKGLDQISEWDQISKWDKQFLEVDLDTLYDLIKAANFLNMPDLVKLTCKKASTLAKGTDPHKIRSNHTFQN
ncbi:S-phase kinase-associated protein 1-like [Trichogramma pretiosum]|uniref:S-phase kinase-associated protein 1-like n=1 Tax=Trichogramma pretiosum TaxID=7493 RepID=UPI0006C95B84|nr:S-phase kinase-associated protein 1-like [Trichogramma pretiosum]